MIVLLLSILALSFSTSTAFAATNTSNTTTSTSKLAAGSASSSKVTFTQSQIFDASYRVKNFINSNGRLPSYVTIKNTKVNMPQFLQLMTQTVVKVNSGSKSSITFKTVSNPSSIPTETVKSGKLYKSGYVSLANSVLSTISSTGKAPGYKNSSLGIIKYQTLIYTFSNILGYCKTNNKLPTYVSVKSWKSITSTVTGQTSVGEGLTGLKGTTGLQLLASYIHKYLNHQYGAATTAAGVQKTKKGDCWGLSAWAAQVLHNNGYTVRIVQGASSEASNHRWDEVLISGNWVRFDPSLVTRHYNLPYYYVCAKASSIIATYT